MLCEAFKKGVEESGNFAKLIRLAEKNIGYCKGCDFCMKNDGVCVQKDDMSEILDAYKKADGLSQCISSLPVPNGRVCQGKAYKASHPLPF